VLPQYVASIGRAQEDRAMGGVSTVLYGVITGQHVQAIVEVIGT
jgi:hypothetical protein